jgi:FkbM family methyltransferase
MQNRPMRAPRRRRGASEAVYRLVALYTRRSPLARGKSFLIRTLQRILPVGEGFVVRAADGRRFELRARSRHAMDILFFGGIDPGETGLLRALVRPGDQVVDVGANVGWYTTLFAAAVGGSGHVYAFEPVPSTFAELMRSAELNGAAGNVTFLHELCGAAPGAGTIYEFPTLHSGLSSARPIGDEARIEHTVPTTTLDLLAAERGIGRIHLLKVDVEGAELEVVRGARGVLRSGAVEALMIEANEERSGAHGYAFGECLAEILELNPGFAVYRMSHSAPTLEPVGSGGVEHGDNLLLALRGSEMHARVREIAGV